MKENNYRYIGWGIFGFTIFLWFIWCMDDAGLAGCFMDLSERLVKKRLTQISCLLTFVILCLPGYIAKQYFERLAWQEHVEHMPRPDIHESARRSKYVQTEDVPPPPPKAVDLQMLPAGQEEFIATCRACGHLFSARKDTTALKCPNCGEPIA